MILDDDSTLFLSDMHFGEPNCVTLLTDAGLGSLAEMPQLQTLSFDDTNVTDGGLAHLKGLTQLEWLYLNDTQVPDGSINYVMLFNILHADERLTMLKEAWRVLATGGKLAVIHWNYDPSTPRGPSMSIRPRPEECRSWAEQVGFPSQVRPLETQGQRMTTSGRLSPELSGTLALRKRRNSCGRQEQRCLRDMTNTPGNRDGGVLVIGKSERNSQFSFDGLTEEQASSFDMTKAANWVNARFSPPIHFACYHINYEGKLFVILVVQEFADIPTVCTKEFLGPDGKPVIKKGAIYVRSPDVASVPLSTVDELRALIGLATTKRGNEFLGMFQAMMKGHSILESPPDNKFEIANTEISEWLDSSSGHTANTGAWTFALHPTRHLKRWNEIGELRAVIEKSFVHLDRDFPHVDSNMSVVDFGISQQWYDSVFGLTYEGLFVAIRHFQENKFDYKSSWSGHEVIPKGKWLDWRMSISRFVDFFLFASRFVEQFDVGEEFKYEIKAGPLNGRKLVHDRSGDESPECKAKWFNLSGEVPAETLRTSWQELAAKSAPDAQPVEFTGVVLRSAVDQFPT